MLIKSYVVMIKHMRIFPKDKTYKLGNPRASVIASIKPDDIFKKYHLDK